MKVKDDLSGYDEMTEDDDWENWLSEMFPLHFTKGFGDHHGLFWEHLSTVRRGLKPKAFFLILARGGGKTTNAEAAPVKLGAEGRRKFCLYVRGSQDKANESVANIAALLESRRFAERYPKMSERKMGKYGNSRGWNLQRLRCGNGFSVVGLGLDAAVRGVKIEEDRPDLIIFDDVDDAKDTSLTTDKKIKSITKSILPAGSNDSAVLGIQNVIKSKGFFGQIASGQADYLLRRTVVGPIPALHQFDYEMKYDQDWGRRRYFITGGIPSWPQGQSKELCESQMNEWGGPAFLSEAQHLTDKEGLVYHQYNDETNKCAPFDDLGFSEVDENGDLTNPIVYYYAVDFGAVNEAYGIFVRDEAGVFYLIDDGLLPQGTTKSRAEILKRKLGPVPVSKRIIAGYGGAKSEKQQRRDYNGHGISLRPPRNHDVEYQVNATNEMFADGDLMICSNCFLTIDMLENCERNEKEEIADKSIWHHLDVLRYLCGSVWRRKIPGKVTF